MSHTKIIQRKISNLQNKISNLQNKISNLPLDVCNIIEQFLTCEMGHYEIEYCNDTWPHNCKKYSCAVCCNRKHNKKNTILMCSEAFEFYNYIKKLSMHYKVNTYTEVTTLFDKKKDKWVHYNMYLRDDKYNTSDFYYSKYLENIPICIII